PPDHPGRFAPGPPRQQRVLPEEAGADGTALPLPAGGGGEYAADRRALPGVRHHPRPRLLLSRLPSQPGRRNGGRGAGAPLLGAAGAALRERGGMGARRSPPTPPPGAGTGPP